MARRKAIPITDELRRMVVSFECKGFKDADPDDPLWAGEFTGYAAGIHNVDLTGDMILPGAFVDDLPRFLTEGVVCWQHNWDEPIGRPLDASEDEYGLMTRAQVSATSLGKDAMVLIKGKVVRKLSIGYRVRDYEWVDRDGLIAYLASTNLSEERKAGILRQYDEMDLMDLFLLKKLKLYEYSPVTFPANTNASITDAKRLSLLTGLTFADHSKAVLTAVQGLSTRAQDVITLKQNRKTKLNPERRSELKEIAELLGESLESVRSLLIEPATEDPKQEDVATTEAAKEEAVTEPEASSDADSDEVLRLLDEFQRIEARRLGCAA